jgi:hypothetical protein
VKPQLWDQYLDACHSRDPDMPHWSAATVAKLRTRVFGMMTEAGYLSDSRRRVLKPVQVSPEVVAYLKETGEEYALRCMQIAP